MKILYVYNLN